MTDKNDSHILIVDDEVLILKILERLLGKYFSKISTATDGKLGLKCLKENKDIKCILSDIRMPNMDGIAFIKEVRRLGHDLPFIFFSGHGSDSLMLEVVKYNAFDFINKPDFENLAEVVLSALSDNSRNDTETVHDDLLSDLEKLTSDT